MRKLIIILIGLVIVGCSSTTIFPEGNGKFSLVTTSSSEAVAQQDAKQKAQEECQNK